MRSAKPSATASSGRRDHKRKCQPLRNELVVPERGIHGQVQDSEPDRRAALREDSLSLSPQQVGAPIAAKPAITPRMTRPAGPIH